MNRKTHEGRLGRLLTGTLICVVVGTACGGIPYEPSTQYDAGMVKPDAGPDGTDDPDEPGIVYNPVKPNVMLLVDRSGSMAEPADCGLDTCPSKWEQLLGLGVYLSEAKQLVNLGLAVFPSPEENGCSVSQSILVPLSGAENVDQQMMNVISQVTPGGKTPVAAAMDEMRIFGGLDAMDRSNTVLILTDGRPNCFCEDNTADCERDAAVAAVERLENSDPPIDVDVIGFGASAYAAHDTLTAMAQAAGDDRYYQSDTIEDLIATMYKIGVDKAPCTFHLDEWPEPDRLIVWLDDVQIPPCTEDPCQSGYLYDPSEGIVEFQGETCAALRDGQRHHVWFDQLP